MAVHLYAATIELVKRDQTNILLAFGFTASLLEGFPIVGLVLSISNRVGAAMWAHGVCFLQSSSGFQELYDDDCLCRP